MVLNDKPVIGLTSRPSISLSESDCSVWTNSGGVSDTFPDFESVADAYTGKTPDVDESPDETETLCSILLDWSACFVMGIETCRRVAWTAQSQTYEAVLRPR